MGPSFRSLVSGILTILAVLPLVYCLDTEVIVVGAGISGLSAGSALKAKGYDVIVLEARNRMGGRLNTVRLKTKDAVIDLGAAWIHGTEDNPITAVAEDNRIKTIDTTMDNAVLYFDNGTELSAAQTKRSEDLYDETMDSLKEKKDSFTDMASLESAIKNHAGVETKSDQVLLETAVDASIVQEYGASPGNLSAAYSDVEEAFDGADAIFPGGYSQVAAAVGKDLTVKLEHVVKKISYGDDQVTVTAETPNGTHILTAKAVLVTIPLGVLKKTQANLFDPPLPAAKASAIQKLGMGLLDKVILLYDKVFWDMDPSWIQRVPTTNSTSSQRYREIFNVAKYIPDLPLLVVFNAGNPAWVAEGDSDAELGAGAHAALQTLYPATAPKAPKEVLVTRWGRDPYSLGSYSYKAIGSSPKDIQALAAPVGDRLFFAGEATSVDHPATVHGAYLSGQAAGQAIAEALKGRKVGGAMPGNVSNTTKGKDSGACGLALGASVVMALLTSLLLLISQ